MRGRSSRKRYVFLFGLAALLLTSLSIRSIDLGADPDYAWLPNDVGYRVDEGYKTLAPRNLVLFGQRQWNEFDQYPGWMDASPVTQWAFYLTFQWFGLERASARLANVAFFGLLLVGFTLYFCRRYRIRGVLLGTTLLGLDVALFQFSRIAIFEIAVALFVYAAVLGAAVLWEKDRKLFSLLVAVAVGTAGVVGVKLSVLVYVAPAVGALAAILVYERISRGVRSAASVYLAITILVLGFAAGLYVTRDHWLSRIGLGQLLSDPYLLVFNPMYQLSPLALALALLATIDVSLRAGVRAFVRSPVLAMSAAMVIFVPMMLAGIQYAPARYYVALVPAALLLVTEWFHLRATGGLQRDYRFTPGRVLAVAPLVVLFFGTLSQFSGRSLLTVLEFVPQGDYAGLGQSTLESAFPALTALGVLAAGVLAWRSRLRPVVAGGAWLGIGVHLAASILVITTSLSNTSYVTDEIQREITQRIEPGETVGGDWAPYLMLDTDVPVLYVVEDRNGPDRMERLRLDYFLNSNTRWDLRTLEGLRENPAVQVTSRERVGSIFGTEIDLHRLEYRARTPSRRLRMESPN